MGVEEEPMQVEDTEDVEESDEEEVKAEEPQVFTLKGGHVNVSSAPNLSQPYAPYAFTVYLQSYAFKLYLS